MIATPWVADMLDELRNRAAEYERVRALVDGAAVLNEIAAELERRAASIAADIISAKEAVYESGFTADHLRRLVRAGALRNYGRKGAPRYRRSELPRKPGNQAAHLRANKSADTLAPARRIVSSVIAEIGGE